MRVLRRGTVIGLVLLMVLGLIAAPLAAMAQGQAGTTLSATVTAEGKWTRTFCWTIDKSVTPESWDLFRGDSGTSRFTITVTKDSGTEEAWVEGQVCVTNVGERETENLSIKIELRNGNPPPKDLIATVVVDVSGNPVLDPSETGCYPYRVAIPSGNVHAGGLYKVTADVTITNHSGHLGEPFGPNPSDTTNLPASPTPINGTINVDDNGRSWEFTSSGSVSYDKTFTCDRDAGTHTNTARIRQTGQSDNAMVTVRCYALQVKKDARTTFTRKYHWDIDKWADQSALTLAIGQQFLVNYWVKVWVTGYTDSDWAVSGNIWVSNPAPIPATINSVSDVVSGVGAATVDCGCSFPYELPAGSSIECTYSLDLPNGFKRTNTATARLQNYEYDYQMNATPDGVTDFSGSADVVFNGPTTKTDECVDVNDSYAGFLGEFCANGASKTFAYSRWIGPYYACGNYIVQNTASFVTNDTGATGSDDWTVAVRVPCPGCTLTIGYWKNHAGLGPQRDMVTRLLPIWLGTAGGAKSIRVTTAAQAAGILGTMGSNGIAKLRAQLLAAKLNIKNGADGSAVASTIAAADAFLATNNAANWSSLTKAQQQMVLGWMNTLDRYNNGLIGPGHCSQ